jgi:uncharacterized protein (DUF58 family)
VNQTPSILTEAVGDAATRQVPSKAPAATFLPAEERTALKPGPAPGSSLHARSWPVRFVGLLTYDFCPQLNRYVTWIKEPLTILVVAALVSLLLGLLVDERGYVVSAAIAIGIALGIVWPGVSLWGVEARLRFDRRRVREGEPAAAILTVTNRFPWPAWGLTLEGGFAAECIEAQRITAQCIAPASAGEATRGGEVLLALASIQGRSQAEFRWHYEPPCRGEYPQSPPQLATSFPFGLWKRAVPVRIDSQLIVWPRTVALAPLALAGGELRLVGGIADRTAGHEGEVIGTRGYRPGDLLRQMHWAQSARQGRWIVCERQAASHSPVRVVIDPSGLPSESEGPAGRLEWTLRIGASICHQLLDQQIPLAVELGGTLLRIEPTSAGRVRLNDALALFRPESNRAGREGIAGWAKQKVARLGFPQLGFPQLGFQRLGRGAALAPARRAISPAAEIVVTTNRDVLLSAGQMQAQRRIVLIENSAIGASAIEHSAIEASVMSDVISIDLRRGDIPGQLKQLCERSRRYAC